jgi:hypothetical protein
VTAPLREITGKRWESTRKVLDEKRSDSKVIRRVVETERLYVVLSCGHTFRWYKSEGHETKKRLRCWTCDMGTSSAGTTLAQGA